MADDIDSRAVRILSDLCGVLRREENIHEFGFVYCPEPLYNKSPIVVMDGNIGIETWSIKLLYFYAHSQLFHNKQRDHDLKRVSDCSMAVVLLNPECLSAWNLRKQLISRKYLKVKEELNLAQLVLTKHPKSPDTFSQRRWLLQQIFPAARPRKDKYLQNTCQDIHRAAVTDPNPVERLQGEMAHGHEDEDDARELREENDTLMTFVRTEIDICVSAASRYPSNYNAWSHRIWVVKHLAGNPSQFLNSELAATKLWVSLHVSDHSGFHYRQFLLSTLTGLSHLTSQWSSDRGHLRPDADLAGGLVLEELQLISDLVTSYPGHEAVWYHRRFVVYLWKSLLCNGITRDSDPIIEGTCSTSSSHMLMPSSKNESIKDRPIANQLLGKRPSENQQIGNQPLWKRPSENQLIKNQALGQQPNENWTVGNHSLEQQPSENRPIENGHRVHLDLAADIDMSSTATLSANREVSQTELMDKGDDDLKQGIPFSAMQQSSRCSHDASLLHLSDQHILQKLPPPQKSVCGVTTCQSSRREVSCTSDDIFSSNEILRLIEHEKRFADIVVEGTTPAEKTAQQRCAENYCRWLENLHQSIG